MNEIYKIIIFEVQMEQSQVNQFQDPNFDPIAYLNAKFPDEDSLVGLDDEIQSLNKQLSEVNQQLIQQIHQHAMMNIQISQQIQKAKVLSKEIIKQIGIIKDKATKSQEIVYDMCKDLKSLDIAKKNLTFSIDALKKFIMMVDALDKLNEACYHRSYAQVANLISAFNELSNHFKKYQQIPQIQDLYKERNKLVQDLQAQIVEDFQAFEEGNSSLSKQNMAAACKIIEILGEKHQRKFIQAINTIVLKQYQEQYGTAQNSILENTERRYGFIRRKMQEFNSKFENIIPDSWEIDCRIYNQFCSITRLHLTQTLERTCMTTNVAVLMKALQLSIKFQNKITELMRIKYSAAAKQGNNKKTYLPRFVGSISMSFQPYLKPYIKSQEDALIDGLNKSMQDDKLTELKVFNSSIILFHGIKNVIKRASTYSKGTLLLDILKVIKKVFRIYSQRCFEKSKKNTQNFEQNICWIINTGDYCKNIIEGVREVLESLIDPAYVDNISFTEEEETFSNLISRSIELFISTLEQKVQNLFTNISRTQWDKVEDIIEASDYVKETKILLNENFAKIKDQLLSLYLTLYMDKIVVLVANKFISNIYKCKKLPSIAYQQLHMDIIQLKDTLLKVVNADQKTYGNQKNKQKHMNFVNKTFWKAENIIKLLSLNNEQFAEKFTILMQGAGLQQLDKILQVRGARRNDFQALVNSIENKAL